MRRNLSFWIIVLALLVGLAACRNDAVVLYPDETPTPEGNMGSNKATLDYLDMTTGRYSRNIYP